MRHEIFAHLLAANTPHNPVRFADTVGLVMERERPEGTIGSFPFLRPS